MKPIYLNFENRSLPSYLGYGILNESTVTFENDIIHAQYILEIDGSVVHEVDWDIKNCKFTTKFNDKVCRTSCYPTLNTAMMSEFNSINFLEDEVFHYLLQTITKMGNVYLQFPGTGKDKQRFVFAPAGLLMCLRLPVKQLSNQYKEFQQECRELGYINFHRERNVHLITSDANNNIGIESLHLAEFIVPLAYVTAAVRFFKESNVIEDYLTYRLMVNEVSQSETASFQFFQGNKNWPYFGFVYKDLKPEEHQEVIDSFSHVIQTIKYNHC